MAFVPEAGAPPPADCIRGIVNYINKMLRPRDPTKAISGMKVLLLDAETKTIVSMAMGMGEILSKDVYLVELLSKEHKGMKHMKAVCLLRPTEDNIRTLRDKLASPEFQEYHLFFTNVLPADGLSRLADADKLSIVAQVQEFYADYQPVNPDAFTLSTVPSLALSRPRSMYAARDHAALRRSQQGLFALCAALKVKPAIRYQATSEAASRLAMDLHSAISAERDLFTFKGGAPPALLLVVDRKEDPLTPLLCHWTYQAMIHQYAPSGIVNNLVSLRGQPGIAKGMEELVVAPATDDFYRAHMHKDFGAVLKGVQALTAASTAARSAHAGAGASLEAMARAIEAMPELERVGSTAAKHMTLAGFINETLDKRRLFEVSEIEQDIWASEDAAGQFARIVELLTGAPPAGAGAGGASPAAPVPAPGGAPPIEPLDALRLCMIYCLRYERSAAGRCAELRRIVTDRCGVAPAVMGLLDTLLTHFGASQRATDLFGGAAGMGGAGGAGGAGGRRGWKGLTSAFTAFVGDMAGPSAGAGAGEESVFLRHVPHLLGLLGKLALGRLDAALYKAAGPELPPTARFGTVIVYMVGGVTYHEAAKIAAINAGAATLPGVPPAVGPTGAPAPPFRVILGGTSFLNTERFLAELTTLRDGGAAGTGGAGVGGYSGYNAGAGIGSSSVAIDVGGGYGGARGGAGGAPGSGYSDFGTFSAGAGGGGGAGRY